ncbi:MULTISPECIES: hypothetical protein [Fusobacterium]|uniref:Uncharacterized protein n=1 Tax=Fusobacterium ulcerans 12-1B TaxID=457404 RepID=H1PTU7_9FUSO|nr:MULTISPECIES: hypothetical protein [Fusobacterium]EHO80767.1 hypothetical protein HMPREF0402_01840 [Fusobacterium ulcerans 12-1B]RGJ31232.1 hypothetical protein DXD66_02590 [Fusobacterium varium]
MINKNFRTFFSIIILIFNISTVILNRHYLKLTANFVDEVIKSNKERIETVKELVLKVELLIKEFKEESRNEKL